MRRKIPILILFSFLLLIIVAIFFSENFFIRSDKEKFLAQVPASIWQRIVYRYKLDRVEKVMWASHAWERAVLNTSQYPHKGNKDVKFTKSGYEAPGYSLARAKLLDVNLNSKVKVRISGSFEGRCGSCLKKKLFDDFTEFGIYLMDESGNAKGIMLLGTRDNLIRGNTRDRFKFTELTVENNGKEIVVSNNTGLTVSYTLDFKYVTAYGKKEENKGGDYGELNPKQKWFLQVNCHTRNEGSCALDIKSIKVTQGAST